MKQDKFLFLCAVLVSFFVCHAQEVDKGTALNIAVDFLTNKKVKVDPTQSRVVPYSSFELAYKAEKDGKVCFYVYNCNNGGYVIVSADSRSAAPVLGYSTVGSFDYGKLGDNARKWLDSYTDAIFELDSELPERSLWKSSRTSGKSVTPLLGETAWAQGYPYNMLCPEAGEAHFPTGCVVTAAAQIMYYNQWPIHGSGVVSNGWDNYQSTIDLSESTYRWDLMQPIYDDSSSPESQEAVAMLMRDLGYAVDAIYCIDGTATAPNICALKLFENFDYSPAITVHYRQYYMDEEWDEIVYAELDSQRPCLYSGYDQEGFGHSFVCDGYDSDGYFHFNFGWNGIGNGYYLSSVANGYPSYQSVVTGIMKNNGEDPEFTLYADDLYYNEKTSAINVSDINLTAIGIDLKNDGYKCGLFIENLKTGEIIFPFDNSLGTTSVDILDKMVSIVAGFRIDKGCLPDGEYNIYLGVGSKKNDRWQKARFPNNAETYISLTVDNGELTYENHIPDDCDEGKVFIDGIYYTLDENNKTACVTNKNSYSRYYHDDVVIPNSILSNGMTYNVVGIGEYAFYKCDHLTSVFIPNSIEYVDKNSFPSSSVKSIVFEQNSRLKSIGEGSFYNCGELENIVLPDGLLSIGDGAFNCCMNLRVINIPESVEFIGSKAFSLNVGSLKDVSVFWKVPKVFEDAFVWGDLEVTLHVPQGTSSLYEELECWSRFNVVEGDWSDKIKIDALWYHLLPYMNIAYVSSPDEDETYSYEELYIPSAVEYDGHNFTVTQLEKESFKNSSVRNIHIPSTVEIIGDYAFNQSAVEYVCFEENSQLSEIQDGAFLFSNLKTIQLPENLKLIKQNAFALTNLSSIEIPVSVEKIEFNPFSSSSNTLSTITVNWIQPIDFGNIFPDDVKQCSLFVPIGTKSKYEETESWSGFNIKEGKYIEKFIVEDDIRYLLKSPDMTAAVVAPADSEEHYRGGDIVIPPFILFEDNEYIVNEIGDSAFEGSEINSISLPNTIETIGFRGFCGSQLKKIEIDADCALKYIERHAFIYCDNLESFPICENLEKISLGAFGYCSSLTEFFIPKSITELDSYCFASALKDVYLYWFEPKEFDPSVFATPEDMTLHVPTGTAHKYKNIEPWRRFGNIIEDESLGTEISLERIVLDAEYLDLEVGDSHQFTASIYPADTTSPELEWWVDDETVASVDQTGFVTLVGNGETIVHVRSITWPDIEATCRLNVSASVNGLIEEDAPCDIYTADGKLLHRAVRASEMQNLDRGLYIIRQHGKTTKFLK